MMDWKNLTPGYHSKLEAAAEQSPHDLLEISIDATPDQVREAWKKLVKTYHPDRADPFLTAHNQEMLKLINRAYEKMSGKSK